MRRLWGERSTYFRAARSRLCPQPTYGFSTGLTSTASPKACIDHVPVPLPPVHGEGTACRQSNEPVTSPSRGRSRRGPYMSASVM